MVQSSTDAPRRSSDRNDFSVGRSWLSRSGRAGARISLSRRRPGSLRRQSARLRALLEAFSIGYASNGHGSGFPVLDLWSGLVRASAAPAPVRVRGSSHDFDIYSPSWRHGCTPTPPCPSSRCRSADRHTTARGTPASGASRRNWFVGASWTSHPRSVAGKCPMASQMPASGLNVSGGIYTHAPT